MRPYTQDGKLRVPRWCAEDTPVPKEAILEADEWVCDISYEDYRKQRRMSYFACRWYPHLVANGIPTIPSNLINTTMLDLREDLLDNWKDRQFVRLCGGSPKDLVEVPIYNNPGKAANDLMRSQRTLNLMHNYSHNGKCHLFIRDIVDIDYECRCFVHQHKLRAVSVYQYIEPPKRPDYEQQILEFAELYQAKLPYNSCVMELGLYDGEFPFVIEFNSFGIDGFADASLFDWDREYPILYHSQKPEFRYPHSVL